MNIPFIDLRAQYKILESDINDRIKLVLEHGQYIMGPEVQELENKLAVFNESNHCITVSSGTDALLISLMALGVSAGDEVITTPFTFISAAEVVRLLGAIPVYVDVELDTGNIDATLIEEKITKKTKAIIPVSLYGQPSDMDAINAVASKHGNIPVIEDGAQSFGATYKTKKSCNLSTVGCTSFFPSKPLGCYGDGGAIFTNDDLLAKEMKKIRVHGQSERYVHSMLGIGGRMDTLQCAVLLAKLERFEWELERRARIAQRYNELLDLKKVTRIQQRTDRTSVFAQYTIICKEREKKKKYLTEKGIPTAIHYPIPVNEQQAYKNPNQQNETPNAIYLAHHVLSLPMSPYLKDADQQIIIDAVNAG